VILLERYNEWNLSPAKEGSSNKKRERKEKKKKKKKKGQGLKSKRGETSYKMIHVSKGEKKMRMEFACCWERFY
jgi:hypothetical protein